MSARGGGAEPKDEEAKKKRRQDRHRTLERIRRDKTQALLASIQTELSKHTGQKAPGEVTLNKTLKHIVSHVRHIRETEQSAGGDAGLTVSNDKAEEKPEDPERLAMLAVMNCETPLAILHMHGGIMDANEAFCEFLGYTAVELIKNTIYVLTAPDDLANLMKEMCMILTNTDKENSSVFIHGVKLIHNQGHFVKCDLDISSHHSERPCYTVWATPEHHESTYMDESVAWEQGLAQVPTDARVEAIFQQPKNDAKRPCYMIQAGGDQQVAQLRPQDQHSQQSAGEGGVEHGGNARVMRDLNVEVPQYAQSNTIQPNVQGQNGMRGQQQMMGSPYTEQQGSAVNHTAGLGSWEQMHGQDMIGNLVSSGSFASPAAQPSDMMGMAPAIMALPSPGLPSPAAKSMVGSRDGSVDVANGGLMSDQSGMVQNAGGEFPMQFGVYSTDQSPRMDGGWNAQAMGMHGVPHGGQQGNMAMQHQMGGMQGGGMQQQGARIKVEYMPMQQQQQQQMGLQQQHNMMYPGMQMQQQQQMPMGGHLYNQGNMQQ